MQDVFRIVPLCTEKHLLVGAQKAMAATVTRADADVLQKALASEPLNLRLVALAGLRLRWKTTALPILRKLLDDSADQIRLESAWALGDVGERQAVDTFAKLLESPDLQVRLRSVQALRALTGQKFKFSAYENPENRAVAVKAWHDWLDGDGKVAELHFPIQATATLLGRTLVCYYSQNKVIEYNATGDKLWELNVPYAWGCQGLPNGHRMVASYSGKYVAEFDAAGKEIWRKTGLPGTPFSVQRLETGNTLVTCSDSQKVVEVDPDGNTAWEVKIDGRPTDAQRLESGNTLVALQTSGRVVEVNPAGEVVWEVNNQDGVLAADRLENGNTLVCRSGSNTVVEINHEKDIVWTKDNLHNPYDAQRLPSGNTLVVDYEGVHEFDPKGETVWELKGNGASRVYRY